MSERAAAAVELAPVREMAELDACVALQRAVWGYADGDVLPRRMFVLANHLGGQVFGARVAGELAGFAMALPGVRDGAAYLHSHMLAVLPPYRDLGLGRRLKLLQREDALQRGIDLMEWTFDPMQAKNAYFNLQRLGAVSCRYEPNFYGDLPSTLQPGLATDRLVARWWLRSERVAQALAGAEQTKGVVERIRLLPEEGGTARAQRCLRDAMQDAFARGLYLGGFMRGPGGGGTYLLCDAARTDPRYGL